MPVDIQGYERRSVFAKWAIQSNSDALSGTHIKWKNLITQLELILTHSPGKNAPSKVELFSIFYFKSIETFKILIILHFII